MWLYCDYFKKSHISYDASAAPLCGHEVCKTLNGLRHVSAAGMNDFNCSKLGPVFAHDYDTRLTAIFHVTDDAAEGKSLIL